MISGWPRKVDREPTIEEMRWNIHAPNVGVANTQGIIDLSKGTRLAYVWSSLNTLRDPEYACGEQGKNSDSIIQRDIDDLSAAMIIQQIPIGKEHLYIPTARIKSVSEPPKTRRRFILWPRVFNDTYEYEPDVSLLTPAEVIEQVLRWGKPGYVAVAYDLRGAFFQHLVSEQFGRYCVFMFEKKLYKILRFPMGATVTPELQQRITWVLVEQATQDIALWIVVHIDNIRFYGEPSLVATASKNFEEQCKEFNCELNSPDTKMQTDFLGMHFDYDARSVALSTRFVDKIKNIDWQDTSLKNVQSIFGRLFFSASVLCLALDQHYYAIKFYRTVCRRESLRVGTDLNPLCWWRSAFESAQEWARSAIHNEPQKAFSKSITKYTLFTDASDHGYGIVLIFDGQVHVTGEAWTELSPEKTELRRKFWAANSFMPSINQRELVTVMFAQVWLAELGISTEHVDLLIDNTSALACVRKGRSNAYWLNKVLSATPVTGIHPKLVRWKTANYIASLLNLADKKSRGLATVVDCVDGE